MSLEQTIRIVGDLVPGRNLIDLNTGRYPFFWSGNKIRFLIALENSGEFLSNFSSLESFTVQIRPSTGNSSPKKGADPVMSKTITVFNESLSKVEWGKGYAGHLEVCFDGSLTSIPEGQYWISLTALMKGSLYSITFGTGPVQVLDNGYASCADLAETSKFAWSRDESDLRYLAWGCIERRRESLKLLQDAVPLLHFSTTKRDTSAYNPIERSFVAANVTRTFFPGDSMLQMGLMEEERENLIPYSQLLQQWDVEGDINVEGGYSFAPDHSQSASRVLGTSGILSCLLSGLGDGDYVFSFYSRNGSVDARIWANEDLQSEVTFSNENKWERHALPIHLDNLSDVRLEFVSEESIDIELWGIQFEKGKAASSYIPTEGTPLVRSADEISLDLSYVRDTVLRECNGTLLFVCYDCQFAESKLYFSSASSIFEVGKIFADYEADESLGFSSLILENNGRGLVFSQIFTSNAVEVYGEGEYGVASSYTTEFPENTSPLDIGDGAAPNGWILPLYWAKALDQEQLGILCQYFHERLERLC